MKDEELIGMRTLPGKVGGGDLEAPIGGSLCCTPAESVVLEVK